ncbi:MAG: nucleotidyl transferase AbiEii/AbiGii toxin family protein [Polaromonas sp.]|nr:nucleotidyl transferase AbiEii/AbiGii toxin family protein [Polaromonas sp.]MDP3357203.1 nucleotidyl transferase AbiEii/AbiGii toxin family protein [Polaromonas sp.]MDP3750575.1 nucleotidyl transferase AbiEii/AbiGii toxin family protein [Polaromonas sp.]
MDSRRWEPGELAFQGGTCLHLAHGSARFSEDLDFMVRGGLSLDGLAKEVQRRLRLPADIPAGLAVSVAPSRSDRNPHAFMVTLSGPDFIGSAKVKIELWQTDAHVLKSVKVIVSTIVSPTGAQAFVPTATLDEILVDKIYALGARERLKPRDIFDLWWLFSRPAPPKLRPDSLLARLSIYPRGDLSSTAQQWLEGADKQLAALQQPRAIAMVSDDLKRWLPSYWPLSDQETSAMIAVATEQLRAGVAIVQAYQQAQLQAGA